MRLKDSPMLIRISCLFFLVVFTRLVLCYGFQLLPNIRHYNSDHQYNGITTTTCLNSEKVVTASKSISQDSIIDSSRILADWDRWFASNVPVAKAVVIDSSSEIQSTTTNHPGNITRELLVDAVLTLNQKAADERNVDATTGRCMLGICASTASEGIATLKSWVTHLNVPRGLLHGMDIDGVPIEFNGGVYIKYNSGGVYTFADIRKSQLGFNAIWKPGDAMLEEYDGTYRGVYFQVELADGEFRQYLLPLDLFDSL